MKPTREQKLAVDFPGSCVVTANAGSGKTRVLVDRYLRIILTPSRGRDFTDPARVLAITFTRKAAAEMLSRVVREVGDLIAAATESSELKKLRYLRERLTNAKISTIHSFCSSLIRDYPIEAGIIPNFAELSDAGKLILKRDAIRNTIEAAVEAEDVFSKDTLDLLRNIGVDNTEKYLSTLLSKREIFPDIALLYDDTGSYNNLIRGEIEYNVSEILSDAIELFRAVNSRAIKGISIDESDLSQLEAVNTLLIANSDVVVDLNKALEICLYCLNLIFTKDFGSIRKKISNNADSELLSLARMRDYKPLIGLAEALANSDFELIAENLSHTLFKLSLRVEEYMTSRKKDEGAIDYDDMLILADELLGFEDIARKVASAYTHILVDEFQDTNRIQYSIVKKIAINSEMGAPELFIVGDAKQGIYGFRNADIRVFNQAARDIFDSNQGANINYPVPLSQAEQHGDIRLRQSFRLLPGVAAFVNYVCRQLFISKNEYSVKYDELIAARSTDVFDTGESSELGSANILISDDIVPEYVSVPALISRIINDGIINNEKGDAYIFSDIAILARTAKNFDQLSQQLTDQCIPYVLASSKGFYQSQEVTDVLSYLKFLRDRHDSMSFAAVLKSPFFGLSDRHLFEISKCNGISYWEKFGDYYKSHKKESEIAYTFETLDKMLIISPGYNLSGLLGILLEESRWWENIAHKPGAEQIISNIDKLSEFAANFESVGFRNIHDFVNELEMLAESSDDSQARMTFSQNAVYIMTIHGSKGLEFPVVILYDTNSRGGRNEPLLVNDKYGISFKINAANGPNGEFIETVTPNHYLNKLYENQKGEEEEKRILYVAMTRAKDHLFISSTLSTKGDGNFGEFGGLAKLLLPACGILPHESGPEDLPDEIGFEENLKYYNNGEIKVASFPLIIKIIKYLLPEPDSDVSFSQEKTERIILNKKIDYLIENEVFSASRFMLFKSDEDTYKHKYLYGFPDKEDTELILPNPLHTEENDRIVATLHGSLLHKTMQEMHDWYIDGKLDRELLAASIDIVAAGFERTVSEKIKKTVALECANIMNSKLLQSVEIDGIITEHSLNLPVGHDFITGSIDALVNLDGEYEVWDWKTNKLQKSQKDFYGGRYEIQMKVYAYLISKMFPGQQTYRARLLFSKLADTGIEDSEWTLQYAWDEIQLKKIGEEIKSYMKEIRSLY